MPEGGGEVNGRAFLFALIMSLVHSHLMTDDIQQIVSEKLRPLLPDEASLSRATKGVVEKLGFFNEKPPPSSRIFDFDGKITRVVDHFTPDGLKRSDYLRAAVREPALFVRKPETIIYNITTLEHYCAANGLNRGDYLRATLARRPSLFCQDPERLIQHIEEGTRYFAQSGVTRKTYLRAAIKQPTLFAQNPETIVRNVDRVSRHFADDGLSREEYVRAIITQPSIFYLNPETVTGNIEKVVAHFARDGLTNRDYLCAAIKQPQLFGQKPETIIRHVNLIAELCRKGLLSSSESVDGLPSDETAAALTIAIRAPYVLCLSESNINLRELYGIVATECKSPSILTKARTEVERALSEKLGHPDLRLSVPKIGPDAGLGPHARNFLLRALIHEGWIKGKTK
jgi:hypothetical protein